MSVVIWHNPRCSKSRQTLALLEDAGHTPEVIRYLDTPPNAAEVRAALVALDLPAIGLVRTGDRIFKELGFSKSDDADSLILAMAAHPALIERPVVFFGKKAALGRPPEAVLALFDTDFS